MATDRNKLADTPAVVLHDRVSYQDADHDPVPGQPVALLYADRGATLGTEEFPIKAAELARLEKLGAVALDHDTIEAKLALAGQRPDARVSPHYISLTSPAEQVRATQAVARSGGSGPHSNKRDLARLALGDLKVMAIAFGHPEMVESDSKEEIIKAITEGDENATSTEEIENMVQRRDEAQISAREVNAEPGMVGTNVTAAGVNATTGEKTEAIEPRRPSKAQEANATEAAKTYAEQEGVDLGSVEGTGADGKITKDDVQYAIDTRDQS